MIYVTLLKKSAQTSWTRAVEIVLDTPFEGFAFEYHNIREHICKFATYRSSCLTVV